MNTASTYSFLVVDDSDIILELVKRHLESQDYEVVTAMSGAEAIAALDDRSFDIILLDVEMPEMNGIEVLKKIRHRTLANNTKIIMLTANKELESVKQCLNHGANDYLLKPFSPTALSQHMKKLL